MIEVFRLYPNWSGQKLRWHILDYATNGSYISVCGREYVRHDCDLADTERDDASICQRCAKAWRRCQDE